MIYFVVAVVVILHACFPEKNNSNSNSNSNLNAGQERPFIVGGDVDKNPCFLPLWWAKLVFLLLLGML